MALIAEADASVLDYTKTTQRVVASFQPLKTIRSELLRVPHALANSDGAMYLKPLPHIAIVPQELFPASDLMTLIIPPDFEGGQPIWTQEVRGMITKTAYKASLCARNE